MGAAERLTEGSLELKTVDGKSVMVRLTAKTKYRRIDEPAKLEDLHTGDRVVVEANEVDGVLVAEEVRFSAGNDDQEHEGHSSDGHGRHQDSHDQQHRD